MNDDPNYRRTLKCAIKRLHAAHDWQKRQGRAVHDVHCPGNAPPPTPRGTSERPSAPPTGAPEEHLEQRYKVGRIGGTPGKHDDCSFFVLDLNHDVFARTALAAYAKACEMTHPELAYDIRERWGL